MYMCSIVHWNHCFLACLCLLTTMCQVSCFEGGQQCLLVADWKVLRSCDTLASAFDWSGKSPWSSLNQPDQVDLLCLSSKEFVSQFKFTLQGTKTYRWDLSVVAGIGDSIISDWPGLLRVNERHCLFADVSWPLNLQLSPWSQSEVIDLNEATSSRWHQEDHRVGLGLPPRAGAGLKNPSSRIGKRNVNDSLVATCASLNSKECLQELRKI